VYFAACTALARSAVARGSDDDRRG